MARFDFKRRRRGTSLGPIRLGLVVGRRALRPEDNGGVDELVLMEEQYRRQGMPLVTFIEANDDDNVPGFGSEPHKRNAHPDQWQAFQET
jgi:hypothetical protein